MPNFLKLMTLTSIVAFSSVAIAQDAETPKPAEAATVASDQATTDAAPTAEETTATETPDTLSMGEEVVDENAPGTTYVLERFNDWELRCIRVKEAKKNHVSCFS